jgi:hypothetical protein
MFKSDCMSRSSNANLALSSYSLRKEKTKQGN